ncbi:DM13 domain-containing protein [Nocardioides bizhenqiangii]|uniref:DM13 domain-containing protein n=1 Tax=Nocardioides bizhenqiangii TaxID=3095076 RepID=A0ABZ0ZXZ3_9ACTN|nr:MULTISPECIES: DM13 domain-containing protein [unclassified Nocardioides]MDZ5622306.1 DM13 domain-containing protein [Nocardioides sp. HM23]WQQ28521.1 DM13 domain-containing protein [Nocardioides sp. HM61]
MSRKKAIWLSVGVVSLVVVVVALLLFQPWLLLIDDEVDEADDAGEVVGTASDGLSQTAFPSDQAGDQEGDEPRRVELAAAEFIDAEHGTSGRALLYLREDGSRYLRLEGFETSNGPDVHVWITDQQSGGDCEGCSDSWGIYDDGDYVKLGALKGNIGDQNYEIPDDADLSGMRSVVIWCDRFNVAFGTAAIA